ncbi:hypothetical protein [Rhodococcus sp. Leaf278]|nr:hypothetical protein [Rhodococcus sp. Leaf278]
MDLVVPSADLAAAWRDARDEWGGWVISAMGCDRPTVAAELPHARSSAC